MGKKKNIKSVHASITAELDEFVGNLIESGRYTSRSEAVRVALRLLKDQERLREMKRESLRGKIQEGLESGSASTLDVQKIKETARAEWKSSNTSEE